MLAIKFLFNVGCHVLMMKETKQNKRFEYTAPMAIAWLGKVTSDYRCTTWLTFSILYSDKALDAISTASCCIWSPMSAFLMTAFRCSLMVARTTGSEIKLYGRIKSREQQSTRPPQWNTKNYDEWLTTEVRLRNTTEQRLAIGAALWTRTMWAWRDEAGSSGIQKLNGLFHELIFHFDLVCT